MYTYVFVPWFPQNRDLHTHSLSCWGYTVFKDLSMSLINTLKMEGRRESKFRGSSALNWKDKWINLNEGHRQPWQEQFGWNGMEKDWFEWVKEINGQTWINYSYIPVTWLNLIKHNVKEASPESTLTILFHLYSSQTGKNKSVFSNVNWDSKL